VLDLATARQLGLATGHARRGMSGTPSPSTSTSIDGGTGTSVNSSPTSRAVFRPDLMGWGQPRDQRLQPRRRRF
jgi:hypothetical protein